MTVQFKSGEIAESEYVSEMGNGTMFLILNDMSVLKAATLLGGADLSEIKVSKVDMAGKIETTTITGYTAVESVSAQGTAARAFLRRPGT